MLNSTRPAREPTTRSGCDHPRSRSALRGPAPNIGSGGGLPSTGSARVTKSLMVRPFETVRFWRTVRYAQETVLASSAVTLSGQATISNVGVKGPLALTPPVHTVATTVPARRSENHRRWGFFEVFIAPIPYRFAPCRRWRLRSAHPGVLCHLEFAVSLGSGQPTHPRASGPSGPVLTGVLGSATRSSFPWRALAGAFGTPAPPLSAQPPRRHPVV